MRRAVLALPIAALTLTALAAAPADAAPPAPPSLSTARAELTALTVAAPHPMTGYARDKFDIWAHQSDHCTTRQDVLARDGKDVVEGPDHCQPTSGSWASLYDDTTATEVAKATIDHMVPLAETWRSRADQ
ncbi:hypothetical protein AB0I22_35640 [Streptomyces sp. NPDC050610]|uniref:hypothetical protein n=1 Tax=Streptomyces sp. NPDC050610 TaxID=3157097 RepID=UPI00341F9851